MDQRMENSHRRAEVDVNKILQGFFVLFVLCIVVVFVIKIASHTDGTVVTVDENNPACAASTQEMLDKYGVGNAVKCNK